MVLSKGDRVGKRGGPNRNQGRKAVFPKSKKKSRLNVPEEVLNPSREILAELYNNGHLHPDSTLDQLRIALLAKQDYSESDESTIGERNHPPIHLIESLVSATLDVPALDSSSHDSFDFYNHAIGNNAASQTQTIAIRVSGDSMINAGIFPGDVLIAEYVRGTYVKPNTRDIVIARIEDAITVKRYYINDNKSITLMPESSNSTHKHRVISQDYENYEVIGIVRQVIHDPRNRT